MAKSQSPALDSSYIYSLTSQLGTGQDASDQMTSFLCDFKTSDGEALTDKSESSVKDTQLLTGVTETFLSDFGEIFWPPYGSAKDQKLRWSTDVDKEKITDLVNSIFREKFHLYKLSQNKDLNVDAKGTTPQPPQLDESKEIQAKSQPAPGSTAHAQPGDDAAQGTMPSAGGEDSAARPTKEEGSASNDPEDSSIHVLTSRNRGSARLASGRTSEVATNVPKSSPPPSPPAQLHQDDDDNKPHKFQNEEEFRVAVLGALDRAKGNNLPGAIQFVRTTLNEAPVRDAISSATSGKTIGQIRLVQITEKYMAWVLHKMDDSCLWVKPYKGKVTNGVVRYAGWTGEDGVFTSYPVTYGTNLKGADNTMPLTIDTPPASAKRTPHRPSTGNTNSKIVNLKMPKGDSATPTTTSSSFPPYIHGDAATMERARSAITYGHSVIPPCTYCRDSGNACMMAERGRTCAFCIAQNRTATHCENARPTAAATDYEPAGSAISASPTSMPPVLTHSGRVSRKPTRDNYIDRSENDSDSALSSNLVDESPAPQIMGKLRTHRKSSTLQQGQLKRPRDSGVSDTITLDHPSDTEMANARAQDPHRPAKLKATQPYRQPEVWFSFYPSKGGGGPKMVAAKDVSTMHAFFDAALAAWKKSGGNPNASFHGVDATWPERPMFVEWRDEKDWTRMMQMLKRARSDDHGETEVDVRYRVAT